MPENRADVPTNPSMKCPICNLALIMTERQSIEIDYCPDCRGIWLDRGELDKIIERSLQPIGEARQDHDREARQDGGHRGSKHGGGHGGGGHGGGRFGGGHSRRGGQRLSWLQELFD